MIHQPENLISLLQADSKKEQVRLLKNLSIKSDQLLAFVFKAWSEYGFTFSQYKSEHQHSGLDKIKMPKFVVIEDGKVNKIGKTSLTVIVAKFFDKANSWHCFFLTFDSLKGKESWKDGQPHYHYISDKFGIPRQKVVEQLKNKNYNRRNLPHIELIRYKDDKD